MELRLYKGAKLLDINGLYRDGNLFVPGAALDTYMGLWKGEVLFIDSPLAGKRICLTVLGPGNRLTLPATVEKFISLCSAAGAQIIYYDGGAFPTGDLILALEIGGDTPVVSYLGAAFRSKPLARKIVANLKDGFKLTYLPDPLAFAKSQYNLKLNLYARLFTPAVAVQLPAGLDVGPWLFVSLMEYMGKTSGMDARIFLEVAEPVPQESFTSSTSLPEAMPEPDPEPQPQPGPEPEPEPQPGPEPEPVQAPQLQPAPPQAWPPVQQERTLPKPRIREQGAPQAKKDTLLVAVSSNSASMSRVQYPDFFAQLELRRRPIKKEPFS